MPRPGANNQTTLLRGGRGGTGPSGGAGGGDLGTRYPCLAVVVVDRIPGSAGHRDAPRRQVGGAAWRGTDDVAGGTAGLAIHASLLAAFAGQRDDGAVPLLGRARRDGDPCFGPGGRPAGR